MLNTVNLYLGELFKILMFLVMLLSFYMFIMTIAAKSKDFKGIYSAWQFPMILALFVDAAFIE